MVFTQVRALLKEVKPYILIDYIRCVYKGYKS